MKQILKKYGKDKWCLARVAAFVQLSKVGRVTWWTHSSWKKKSQHFRPITQTRGQDYGRYILQHVDNGSYTVLFSRYQRRLMFLSPKLIDIQYIDIDDIWKNRSRHITFSLFCVLRYRHSVGWRGSPFQQKATLIVEKCWETTQL